MPSARCSVVISVVAAALVLGGCPGSRSRRPQTGNTTVSVEIEGEGSDRVDGSGPGLPLEDPAPPDPSKAHLAYLKLVEAPLQDAWQTFLEDCRFRLPASHPLNDAGLAVVLAITLDRGGLVRAVKIAHESGTKEFDHVAVEIVGDIGAFSTPPADVISDDGRVYLTWSFARDRRQAGVATAELRRDEWPAKRAVPELIAGGRIGEAASRIARAASELAAGQSKQREVLIKLLDETAIAIVRRALASDDIAVQRIAISAAASGRMSAVSGELRRIARHGVDLEMRREAMLALGAIGDRGAESLLRDALAGKGKGGTEEIVAAGRALVALGDKQVVIAALRGWLTSTDDSKRWAALAIMERVAVADAVGELAKLLDGDGARDDKLAAAAALGAAASGKARDALKALIAGLASPDAALRAACAQAIAVAAAAGVKSRAAYVKLSPLLGDRDERVRAAAVLAAARLEPSRFAKELWRLRKEPSALVLAALADGLTVVPGGDARQRLAQLVRSDEAPVRRSAARALSTIGDDASRTAVAGLIGDQDGEVRVIAASSLTDQGVLAKLLDAEPPALRAAALARWIELAGRAAALGEVSRRLADSADRADVSVTIAGSWLAPGWLVP